jgi:hypothetical protein
MDGEDDSVRGMQFVLRKLRHVGKPVAALQGMVVWGDVKARHGVVLAKSELAKRRESRPRTQSATPESALRT